MGKTLDQCVQELADLAKSGETDWESHVDHVVEEYFGGSTEGVELKKQELFDKFDVLAPDRERSSRIRERILRHA